LFINYSTYYSILSEFLIIDHLLLIIKIISGLILIIYIYYICFNI